MFDRIIGWIFGCDTKPKHYFQEIFIKLCVCQVVASTLTIATVFFSIMMFDWNNINYCVECHSSNVLFDLLDLRLNIIGSFKNWVNIGQQMSCCVYVWSYVREQLKPNDVVKCVAINS